jgi:hypothetical protein
MRTSIVFSVLLQAFLALGATTPLVPRNTCGEYETPCGSGCCGELVGYCADASKSLCCEQGQVEMDGICCWTGGTVTNGVCCPAGQANCNGVCCPGECFELPMPFPIRKIPLAKRGSFCIPTDAGCKTLNNASGATCSTASQCTGESVACESGCCINVPIIPK